MGKRRFFVTLLLAAAATITVAAQASAAQVGGADGTSGFGIRWVDVPADAAADPRSATYLIETVPPGATFTRKLGVTNYGPRTITARIYPVAATIEDGDFVIREDVQTQLLRWVSARPTRVEVVSSAEGLVDVAVDVPENAPRGEHIGAVLVEVVSNDGNIDLVSRLGARVYLTVDESGSVPANFSIVAMTARRDGQGVPIVDVEVESTGGGILDVIGDLSLLEGPAGVSVGPVSTTEAATLAPGERGTVSFALDQDLPAGPWLARADLRSGLIERSAEATISFPTEAGTEAAPVEAVPIYRDRGFLLPLALGLLLLAMFLVFLVWWFARRRRDEDEDATEPDVVGV